MIIDFHTHVLPPGIKEDRSSWVGKDGSFARIYSGKKVAIATTEDLLLSMDCEGVDFSVIVNYAWSTHELCVETNDYILESSARYPKRLMGFCAVSDYYSDASVNEIERCARGGARGVGELRPDIQLSRDRGIPGDIYQVIRQYGLILMTHSSEPVGHLYPGKGAATPEVLCGLINGLPDVPVVCAHWGGGLPFYALMPEIKGALKSVYFDTAASPYLYRPEIYAEVDRLVGAEHILFGSDYPVMSPGRIIKEISGAGLPEEDRRLIFSDNARKLLSI